VIAETATPVPQLGLVGAALGIQIPIRRDSWLLFQFPRDKIPYFYFALALAARPG